MQGTEVRQTSKIMVKAEVRPRVFEMAGARALVAGVLCVYLAALVAQDYQAAAMPPPLLSTVPGPKIATLLLYPDAGQNYEGGQHGAERNSGSPGANAGQPITLITPQPTSEPAGTLSPGTTATLPPAAVSEQTEAARTTTTTTTLTSEPAQLVVASDAEYEAILARLREEALAARVHPADYVANDEELEFVLDSLAEGDEFAKDRLERWQNDKPMVATKCPICLEDLDTSGHTYELGCHHKFHLECIKELVKADLRVGQFSKCPMCRRNFEQRGLYKP